MNIPEWKTQIEADIRQNLAKHINPEILKAHEAEFRAKSLTELGAAVEITFASDAKIESYLNNTNKDHEPCCIVCIKLPFGVRQCTVPHNGPCNMCA